MGDIAISDWVSGGSVGVVCGVLLYVFKSLLPGLMENFRSDLKEQRGQFLDALEKERTLFKEEIGNERREFYRVMQLLKPDLDTVKPRT